DVRDRADHVGGRGEGDVQGAWAGAARDDHGAVAALDRARVVGEARAGGRELADRVSRASRDRDGAGRVVVGGARLLRRAVDLEVEAPGIIRGAQVLDHLDRAGRDVGVRDRADDRVALADRDAREARARARLGRGRVAGAGDLGDVVAGA